MELSSENERLRSENARLFSTAIEERNANIAQLEQANCELREKVALSANQLRFVQRPLQNLSFEFLDMVVNLRLHLRYVL